jgi:hypothetical protein
MLRVQMYELSLKQDLEELFGVSEEKTERMYLSSILPTTGRSAMAESAGRMCYNTN